MRIKNLALPVVGLLAFAGVAWAAGFSTNGLPTLPSTVPYANYPQLLGNELVAVDTGLGNGQNPQSVAANIFQIGTVSACIAGNTSTASGGAATSSTQCGLVTSESLSTAAGSSYTLTLTNTLVAATSKVYVGAFLGTSTGGAVRLVSVTPGSGSVVIVIKNVGSAALNGTIKVAFAMAI